jgi:phospholipase/carboxylesterase
MTEELSGFRFRFEPGTTGGRTLLLLHGTGADENDLLPLGRALDPGANLLSPRGKVSENGMPRFFRRLAEGVFDVEDLKKRTDELAEFVKEASARFSLDAGNMVAVGFSNGANIAGSTLFRHPDTLSAAVLLRPMVPYEIDEPLDLQGKPVFIGAGRSDPLIDPAQNERLAQMLAKAGAAVDLQWVPGGHQLDPREVDGARTWMGLIGGGE